MEYRTLPDGTTLPVLGFGTWGIGGKYQRDDSLREDHIKIVTAALEAGFFHIDTAECYANGLAEEIVGEAIKAYDRDDVFITTKVSPENLQYDDVLRSAENSLKRLQVNHIDLYLIHIPNPNISIQETMSAMAKLTEDGRVRYVGVSNFNVEQIKEAQQQTEVPIAANQVEYNYLVRRRNDFCMECEIIPYCNEQEILVMAFSPLAGGELVMPGKSLLTKLQQEYGEKQALRVYDWMRQTGRIKRNKAIEVLYAMAKKYNKTPAQIALNWLMQKPNMITMFTSVREKHIKENTGALWWALSKKDCEILNSMVS